MRVLCVALFSACLSISGCSTVVFSEVPQSTDIAAAAERDSLIAAAASVADTPWPRPASMSLAGRLSGGASGEIAPSAEETAALYLGSLSAPRKPVVLAAASSSVEAARRLAAVGDAALSAMRPARSDVTVIEGAIADLRRAREVYIACLRQLGREGEIVEGEELRRLRASFSDAIRQLGKVADALADRAEGDPAPAYAGPPAPRFLN